MIEKYSNDVKIYVDLRRSSLNDKEARIYINDKIVVAAYKRKAHSDTELFYFVKNDGLKTLYFEIIKKHARKWFK